MNLKKYISPASNHLPMSGLNERENASLIYVGMTRAKTNLIHISSHANETYNKLRDVINKYSGLARSET